MIKDENEKALYKIISGNLSKLTKSKVTGMKGHSNAKKRKDLKWLIDTLDDIMIGFKRIKSPYLACDDKMEKIMKI